LNIHKYSKVFGIFVVFIAIIFSFSYGYSAEIEANPDAAKECSICHYEWMPSFLHESTGTKLVPFQKEKVVADEKMCFSCHNGTVGDSRIKIWSGDVHKLTDEIPEHIKIPKDLPLDNGQIACRTCHTAHATGNPREETVASSVFLRVQNQNSELCRKCHTDHEAEDDHPFKEVKETNIKNKLKRLDGKLGSKNQVICQSCHTPHSPKEKKLLIYYLTDSQLCTICHENKVNPDNTYVKGMLNHPINVMHDDKQEVQKIKDDGGIYAKTNEVICLTCHTPHNSKGGNLLIMANKQDALCLDCHQENKTVKNTPHDMHKVENFRTKDNKTAKEAGVCGSCHAPHGWALKLPEKDKDLITEGCLSCHKKGGYAPKKTIDFRLHNHPVGKEVKEGMDEDKSLPLFGKILGYFTEVMKEGEKKRIITCATCHDVHAEGKKFLRKETVDGTLCLTCHDEKKMINNTKHGKDELDKTCLSCHKIHNSDNKKLLTEAKNDGCLTCHKKGGSAAKSLIGEHSHPYNFTPKMKINKPFKLTDNTFTCVSCHNPHKDSKTGGMEKDFIRGDFAGYDNFCIACHEDQKVVKNSDHDLKKEAEKKKDSVCYQCHTVHNAETEKYMMALKYQYENQNDYCNVCHREDGSAEKKIAHEDEGHITGKIEKYENYTKYLTEKDGEYMLFCSNCHSAHENGPVKGEEGDFSNSFIRDLDNRTAEKLENICIVCHDGKKDFAESKHNINKFENTNENVSKLKASGDVCGICHQVHNSGYYLVDKKFGKDLQKFCQSCHEKDELADKTAIKTSHPMDVKPDIKTNLFLQDDKIICATCHEPHKTTKGMIADSSRENICFVCHDSQSAVTGTEHNMTNIDYVNEELKKKSKENVCYVCHKPHNFSEDVNFMWAFKQKTDEPFAFEICFNCHSDEGAGYKKVPEVYDHDKIFKIFPYREHYKEYLYSNEGEVSAAGSITCQTCHNPHVWKEGAENLHFTENTDGDEKNSFLKQKVSGKFCTVCHGEEGKTLFDKYHDKNYRDGREKKLNEKELLKRLYEIRERLEGMKQNE